MNYKKKEDEEGIEGDGDFTIDEKSKQVHLTERGQIKVEELLTERGLIEEGDSLYSAASITLLSHVYAALRAHKLYQKMLTTLLKKTKLSLLMSTQVALWKDVVGQKVYTKP